MKKNSTSGLNAYYASKVDELSSKLRSKRENLLRLTAQRNELNQKVRALKEELQLLQESGSSIGEVVKQMGKKKVLVKVRVVISASFPQIHKSATNKFTNPQQTKIHKSATNAAKTGR